MANMRGKAKMLTALALTLALLAGLLAVTGLAPAAQAVGETVRATPDETMASSYTTDASRNDLLGYANSQYPNGKAFVARDFDYKMWQEHDKYMEDRYDFFYNHENELKEAKVHEGTPVGFYVSARWYGFMQFSFSKPKGVDRYLTNPEHLTYIDSMVPKYEGTDVYLYGKDFTLSRHTARFCYDTNAGVLLVGMRMAEPGRFTDAKGIVDSGVFLKVNKDSVKLVDGGVEKTLDLVNGGNTSQTVDLTTGQNNTVFVDVKLTGNTISGSVQPQYGKTYTFKETVTYDKAGYAAVGFGSGRLDMKMGKYTVSGLKTANPPSLTEFDFDTSDKAATLMGWNGTQLWAKQPNGNSYSSGNEHWNSHSSSIETWYDYLADCFDLYYQDSAEFKCLGRPSALAEKSRAQGNIGISKTETGYAANVMFYDKLGHWVQLSRGTQAYDKAGAYCTLVPKNAYGKPMTGKNFELSTAFRFDYNTGTALIGFRMKDAGKFVGADGTEGANGVYITVTPKELYLVDNGTKTQLASFPSPFNTTRNDVAVSLRVNGASLTGTATMMSTGNKVAFESKISNGAGEYFTYGFGNNRFDLGSLKLHVSDQLPEQYVYSSRGYLGYDIYSNKHRTGTNYANNNSTYADMRPGTYTPPYNNINNERSVAYRTYMDSKFDLYFNDASLTDANQLKKLKIDDLTALDGKVGMYPAVLLEGKWAQFSRGKAGPAIPNNTANVGAGAPNWKVIASLVPKGADGQPFTGKHFEMKYDSRLEGGSYINTTTLIGFRMGVAGQFVGANQTGENQDGVDNGVILAISHSDVKLVDGKTVTTLGTWGTKLSTSTNMEINTSIKVQGNKLTGTVTAPGSDSDKKDQVIEINTEISDGKGEYIAYGFGDGRGNCGDMTITKLPESTEEDNPQPTEPELTVRRANNFDPDHEGEYRYIVTVNPQNGRQLKAGSLIATGEDNSKHALQRVGYREDPTAFDEYEIYTTEYISITGAFCGEPKTDDEANFAAIGTSVNTATTSLRYVFRMQAFQKEHDGAFFMTVNGKEKEISDFGVLMAMQEVLDSDYAGAELTLDLKGKKKIEERCISAEKVYFDRCDQFVDFSMAVHNIAEVSAEGKDITARAYLTFKDGTTLYTDAVSMSYNDAKA